MTVDGTPDPGDAPAEDPVPPVPQRLDNGLVTDAYVPLADVEVPIAPHLLTALGRARIPAYFVNGPSDNGTLRLFVASEERADARTIVASVFRAAGGDPDSVAPVVPPDPLAGVDTDAAFAEMIADWHVDTHTAIREAEKSLTAEDDEWQSRLYKPAVTEPTWLDDEHYVPPPPPPLPRLAAPTILAILLILASVVLFVFGSDFDLGTQVTMLLGVGGVLVGTGILIMRLRVRGEDDGDDDGAII